MLKFFEKHKIFFLLILALLTLAAGMFFMAKDESDIKTAEAKRTYTYTYKVKAQWTNGSSTGTGNYKNKGGKTFNISAGNITISRTAWAEANDDSYWSGDTFTDTLTGEITNTYTGIRTGLGWKKFSYSASCSNAAESGFEVSSTSGSQSVSKTFEMRSLEGGGSESGSYTVTFKPKAVTVTLSAKSQYIDRTGDFYRSDWITGKFSDGSTTKTINTQMYEYYDFLETPTCEGYIFLGWYPVDYYDVEQEPERDCRVYSSDYIDYENVELFALWAPRQYIVYAYYDYPEDYLYEFRIKFGDKRRYPWFYIKRGYTLKSLNTKADGTGVDYFKYDIIEDDIYSVKAWDIATDDYTLYCQWTPNVYQATFALGSASVRSLNGWSRLGTTTHLYKNITMDTPYGTLPDVYRTGYTIEKFTVTSGGTTYTITSSTNMDYGNHTLVAHWRENKYNIAFDANGGTGSMTAITDVLYTQSVTLNRSTFTRPGYYLAGWSLTKNGSVDYLESDTVKSLSSVDGATVTLYAVWEETWANSSYILQPSGSGTASDPYLIASAANLAWMAYQTENASSDLGGYFKQTANIDLSAHTWLSIGWTKKFIGNYDGNGYVITNFKTLNYVDGNGFYLYDYIGLFGKVSGASISNVTAMSGNIYANNYSGAIVGEAVYSTIKNCSSYLNISAFTRIGGIVGFAADSTIENCYSTATITSNYNLVGGIVGFMTSTNVLSCGFGGSVNTAGRLICGANSSGTVKDCFANVSSSRTFCEATVTIESCLYISGSSKYYYAGTFENWVISTTKTPLPSGLAWIANGGERVTDVSQIGGLGYTLKA